MTNEPKRRSPEEVHDMLDRGEAVLVCAYEDDEKCRDLLIEGARLYSQLEAAPADRELVFYCA